MPNDVRLPDAYAALEPLAAIWALPTENLRSEQRWRSSPADFQALYDAVFPQLDNILADLDQYQLGHLPAPYQKLLHLMLAFVESAPHVELYKGKNQVPISFENRRCVPRHGDEIYG